jgi:hypothetical protein
MIRNAMARRVLSLLGLLALAPFIQPASAQSCPRTFGPVGPSFRPSTSVAYDQVWSVPARAPNGWTIAWSEGQDIYARRFDLSLNPLGSPFLVNSTYNLEIQDEPAIAYSTTTGNFLIAWSERHGYDGSGMGVMGRVYDVHGNPLGTEYVIPTITYASQWRPLIAPTPSGGFVVAWTGDNDGNSYIKILDETGGFLTSDVPVNTYTYDAQVDPSAAVAPNGTIFVAFVDFSSHGYPGTGLNLYGRMFDAAGNALQAQEFLLTSSALPGDQRDPRVASDGQGRFFVTWSDELGDGSGYGIFERVFDVTGAPLGSEFQVNTTTAGDQMRPIVVADQTGRTLITWEDDSLGAASSKIRARRFDELLAPAGPDFVVNDVPATGASMTNPAMDASGGDILIGYMGPGDPGNGIDVRARRYESTARPQVYCSAKTNSLGCVPAIGYSGTPSATPGSPFLITAANVLSHKLALMFYGYDSKFTPFQGSVICVAPPLKRMAVQDSGGSGSGTNCTGTLSTDFNTRIQSGADVGLVPGATISARWYYRDPQDPAGFATGLTDALRFAICP